MLCLTSGYVNVFGVYYPNICAQLITICPGSPSRRIMQDMSLELVCSSSTLLDWKFFIPETILGRKIDILSKPSSAHSPRCSDCWSTYGVQSSESREEKKSGSHRWYIPLFVEKAMFFSHHLLWVELKSCSHSGRVLEETSDLHNVPIYYARVLPGNVWQYSNVYPYYEFQYSFTIRQTRQPFVFKCVS